MGIEIHSGTYSEHYRLVKLLLGGIPNGQIAEQNLYKLDGSLMMNQENVESWRKINPEQPLPGSIVSTIVLKSHLEIEE